MSAIRECTVKRTSITHSSGLKIWICDQWYEHLTLKESTLTWIRKDFHPMSSQIMIIFGVSEIWKEASNYPTRQVVFMLANNGAVVAYDRGILFYICPTFQDFWTANIVFEFYNAVFPTPIRKHVRQMYMNVEGYVNFYNRLRMSRVLLSASERQVAMGRPFSFRGNRVMRMLVASDIAISHGGIPQLFSNRVALHCNVDNRFFSMYWKTKCESGAKPFICDEDSKKVSISNNIVNKNMKIFEDNVPEPGSGLSPLSRPFCSMSGKDTSSVIFIPYVTDEGCVVNIDGIIRKRTTGESGEMGEKIMRLGDEEPESMMDVADVDSAHHDKKEESAQNFSFVIRNDQGSC